MESHQHSQYFLCRSSQQVLLSTGNKEAWTGAACWQHRRCGASQVWIFEFCKSRTLQNVPMLEEAIVCHQCRRQITLEPVLYTFYNHHSMNSALAQTELGSARPNKPQMLCTSVNLYVRHVRHVVLQVKKHQRFYIKIAQRFPRIGACKDGSLEERNLWGVQCFASRVNNWLNTVNHTS